VFIGICRMELTLPGNDSLKGKRGVVRRVLDRTRNRFNVAAAEVDALDVHRRAVLAFVVVSNDAGHASSMLEKIGSFVGGITEAVVSRRETELIPVGELRGDALDGVLALGDEDEDDDGDGGDAPHRGFGFPLDDEDDGPLGSTR